MVKKGWRVRFPKLGFQGLINGRGPFFFDRLVMAPFFLFFLHFPIKVGGYNDFISVCGILLVDRPMRPLGDRKKH